MKGNVKRKEDGGCQSFLRVGSNIKNIENHPVK